MAQTQKHIPKYMCLKANSQFELAQNIDAAFLAAEQATIQDAEQLCYQVFYDQLVDQLHEEYGLYISQLLKLEQVTQKSTLQQAMLDMLQLCGQQFQVQGRESTDKQSFQLAFKLVLERSLLDALDIIMARGLWRFDLQRSLQNIQKQVFMAVDKYCF